MGHILGIDIAKASFDTALTQDNRSYEQASFSNDRQGFKELVEWLAAPLVECSVPDEYATIGEALADPDCDVINIASGIYPENLEIAREVTIAGAGAAATVIDGGALHWRLAIFTTGA